MELQISGQSSTIDILHTIETFRMSDPNNHLDRPAFILIRAYV